MKTLYNIKFKNFKGVFYWAALFTYSQSLIVFFWDLKSFLLRLSLGEILGFLSYQLTFSLTESFIVSLCVIIVTYIIPIKHVRNNIQATGSLFVISLAINGLIFRNAWQLTDLLTSLFSMSDARAWQIIQFCWLYTMIGLPIISIILIKYKKVNASLITFTENLSVLGSLYFLLGILGVLNVIYRNLT